MQRVPYEERWSPEGLEFVGGVPWRISDDDPKVDGAPMMMGAKLPELEKDELEKEAENRGKVPRRFPIERKDLEEFGFTKDCPGC